MAPAIAGRGGIAINDASAGHPQPIIRGEAVRETVGPCPTERLSGEPPRSVVRICLPTCCRDGERCRFSCRLRVRHTLIYALRVRERIRDAEHQRALAREVLCPGVIRIATAIAAETCRIGR